MKPEDFNKIVDERNIKTKSTLVVKQKEYAHDDERFHSFKTAARIENITPERALHGMMLKHYVSYMAMLDNLDKGIIPSKKLLDDKVGDIINFFVLFEGMVLERHIEIDLATS